MLVAFSFTSCKKDYTCSCTFSGVITGSASETYPDLKKKDAEDKEKLCIADNGTVDTGFGNQTTTCTWSKN